MGRGFEEVVREVLAEFELNSLLSFVDVREELPTHSTREYSRLDLGQYEGVAVHHTATPSYVLPKTIAEYHVNTNGWAGIGYHVLVSKTGFIYYVGDLDTKRAHVYGRNHELIGVSAIGNFQSERPNRIIEFALMVVVLALERLLQRDLVVEGHSTWALEGHDTVCPGMNLVDVVDSEESWEDQLNIFRLKKTVTRARWLSEYITRQLEDVDRELKNLTKDLYTLEDYFKKE